MNEDELPENEEPCEVKKPKATKKKKPPPKKGKTTRKPQRKAEDKKQNATKPNQPSKKEAPKAKDKTKPAGKTVSFGAYTPGVYSQKRLEYINENMEWYGCTRNEASQWWNDSEEKWTLLADVPHKELVRRRFV